MFFYGSDIRCHLTWLKYWPYKVLIISWKILAHSPNILKEAKVQQKSKKFKILILCLGYNDMVKNISRYCPFKSSFLKNIDKKLTAIVLLIDFFTEFVSENRNTVKRSKRRQASGPCLGWPWLLHRSGLSQGRSDTAYKKKMRTHLFLVSKK